MKIKLNRLALENFKGIRNFEFEPGGQSCTVLGDNGAGKTTLQDGFLWLLFDKNAQDKKGFAIKTVDENGRELHNLEHSVEADLDIDGTSTVLKKTYKEVYTRKRGSPVSEFSGHTTDYFIDGVPIQKKEWDTRLKELIDEDTFKLLTSPTHFNKLGWQQRRQILLDVCGDISDEDVIKSDTVLSSLPEIIGNRTMEDHKKVVTARIKKIQERLKEIPARIDELSKSIADPLSWDEKKIVARVRDLEAKIQEIKDGSEVSKLRAQKAELEAELAELTTKRHFEKVEAAEPFVKRRNDLFRQKEGELFAISDMDRTEKALQRTIEMNEKRMQRLREEFKIVSQSGMDVGFEDCPACGRPLPEEQVKEAVEKFNAQKAERLEAINEAGGCLKQENEACAKQIDDCRAQIAKAQAALQKIEVELKKIPEQEVKAVEKATAGTEAEITRVKSNLQLVQTAIAQIIPRDDIGDLENELATQQSYLADIKAARRSQERIKELGLEEKDLAMEQERLELQLSLLERFVVKKVELLDDKINSKFEVARFRLFERQINGGISETCVTLVDGVPYGLGLNTGGEINAGLDIIRTLSEHYGIKTPMFVDHAESVTKLLDPGTQMIKLAVDETRQELEVVYV